MEPGLQSTPGLEGGSDLVITYIDGFRETAQEIGFTPIVEGGFRRAGYRAADGNESIRVRYDFDSASFVAGAHGDKAEIKNVRFDLAVGNDYQVWASSNRQTARQKGGTGQELPAPLLVARAAGNVQDNSNVRLLSFDYGLPTATHVVGATIEMRDVRGVDIYAEYDRSYSYRMYPNTNLITHRGFSGTSGRPHAETWMVNISKKAYPYFLFGEAFSMDHDYSTTANTTRPQPRPGFVDYGDQSNFFDFVEDNDDQDHRPDNDRIDHPAGDFAVFPGWDENNDFISDFNQNDNRRHGRPNDFPDYEEPFLRFNVDRPEFLFGPDMNNNGWIDRFENDDEPDYPYRRDHRGYNVYGGAHVTPEIKLVAGRIDERLISDDRHNRTNYLLATIDRDYPGLGRVRLYDMVKRAEDDIAENLSQWVYVTALSGGEQRQISDPLLFEDAWHNSLWLGVDYTAVSKLRVTNKLKYDLTHSGLGKDARRVRGIVQNEHFFGLINKVGYVGRLGLIDLEPGWKSEYRHESRDLLGAGKDEEWSQLVSLLGRMPVLERSVVEAGVELHWQNDLRDDVNDLTGRVVALQATNRVDYLGYLLTTQLGVKFDRRKPKDEKATTTQETFILVFAGLE